MCFIDFLLRVLLRNTFSNFFCVQKESRTNLFAGKNHAKTFFNLEISLVRYEVRMTDDNN